MDDVVDSRGGRRVKRCVLGSDQRDKDTSGRNEVPPDSGWAQL